MRIIYLIPFFVAQVSWACEYASKAESVLVSYKEIDIKRLSNINYGLTREQESALSAQAMSGEASAALRVAQRYFFDIRSNEQGEVRNNALKWALIGAENGSAEAQFLAYQLMGEGSGSLEQTRALYWLKRSADNGFEDAKILYKQCPTISSRYASGSPCFGPDDER